MNRIKELRIKHGYTQDSLGRILGVQKAAICKYETGRANPSQDILLSLCDLFNVSTDYLLSRSDYEQPTSVPTNIPIPIVGRVHAGLPILAEENVSDYVHVSEQDLGTGTHFFMEVEGDCMTDAHIIEGSLVLVRLQPRVENGQIAVVRIDDEVVVRRVKWIKNQLILFPANPKYDPMIISGGDAEIIGRVVEVRIRDL